MLASRALKLTFYGHHQGLKELATGSVVFVLVIRPLAQSVSIPAIAPTRPPAQASDRPTGGVDSGNPIGFCLVLLGPRVEGVAGVA